MNKEFIPYDLALELKELGFDEPCLGVYHRDGSLMSIVPEFTRDEQSENFGLISNSECLWENDEDSINGIQEVATPLYQQAFRWFREKYGLHPHYFVQSDSTYVWCIRWFEHGRQKDVPYYSSNTYEEAEHACLLKLIEIAKQK